MQVPPTEIRTCFLQNRQSHGRIQAVRSRLWCSSNCHSQTSEALSGCSGSTDRASFLYNVAQHILSGASGNEDLHLLLSKSCLQRLLTTSAAGQHPIEHLSPQPFVFRGTRCQKRSNSQLYFCVLTGCYAKFSVKLLPQIRHPIFLLTS